MPNLRVNIVQFNIAWQNPEKNLAKIEKLLSGAKKSDLIVLPEMFTTGFTMNCFDWAEEVNGTTMKWMAEMASRLKSVIAGSIILNTNGSYYNSLIWMRPDGTFELYHKRHLFRMAGEDENFTEGQHKIYPVLKGWRVCPLICYDLRFPVWSRNQNDYDLLIYVANWPEVRREAWMTLARARAIENLSPVIAVNRIGEDQKGISYSGDSMVYDAEGKRLNKLEGKVEGVDSVVLKSDQLKEFRERFPTYLDADSFAIQE